MASRIAAEANAFVAQAVADAFANGQPQLASAYDRHLHHKRDVVTLTDPVTGQRHSVQGGAHYFWIDARGRIAGTDVPYEPHPLWFRDMLAVKP